MAADPRLNYSTDPAERVAQRLAALEAAQANLMRRDGQRYTFWNASGIAIPAAGAVTLQSWTLPNTNNAIPLAYDVFACATFVGGSGEVGLRLKLNTVILQRLMFGAGSMGALCTTPNTDAGKTGYVGGAQTFVTVVPNLPVVLEAYSTGAAATISQVFCALSLR